MLAGRGLEVRPTARSAICRGTLQSRDHDPLALPACIATGAAGLFAFTVGRYPVSLADLVHVLFAKADRPAQPHVSAAVESVILQVRGPRVLAAVMVGAALAVAGTAFQGLFRNPLVSPDILGASSGAALGAVVGIFFSLGIFAIQGFAFVGGLVAVAAVYVIGSMVRARDPILVLVLTGVVVGALLGAGVGLVKYLADPYNQLPAMTFWLLGSLSATTVSDLLPLFGPVALGTAVLIALRWRMNVMSLPEEEARALGVATGPLAHRHRRGGDAGDLGERRHRRHHRLGRPGGAASGALAGRTGFRAAAAGGGDSRRRLSAADRHAGAHRGGSRNPARHSDRGGRHAVLHLAAGERAEELVVKSVEGHDLTIGYTDHMVGRGLDVALETGEVLALLGPNGGGKTTLLKTLLGLLKPKAGEVRLGGKPLGDYSIRERARIIAYVPQVHIGTFAFTVETVVLMGRTAHGNLFSRPSAHDRDVAQRRARALRHRAAVDAALHQISGGERQLVLLARALAQEPQFIVLDEPTASLDFGNQGKVMSEIRALAAVRPRRAVHHARSQPRAARRRPRLPAARRHACIAEGAGRAR